MRNKRKGININTRTFRVVPDAMVRQWWQRELDATTIMVWTSLQLIAVDTGRTTFTEIARTCRISKSTLSNSIRKLIECGLLQRTEKGFTVVFEPEEAEAGSKIEPSGSKIEPSGSKIEPSGSKIEPQLSSNRPGELKRDIESHGDSRETPTPRCAASPVSSSSSNKGGASADSHIHISPEDLALLAQRYGIRFARQPSPWAAVIIRTVLNGEGGEGHIEILRTLAARGSGDFGGAVATAPREANTLTNGGA